MIKTDIDELSRLVNLPQRPLVAQWQTAIVGKGGLGPADWELIAVLTYEPAVLDRLLAGATAQSAAERLLASAVPPAFGVHAAPEDQTYVPDMCARTPLLNGSVARLRGTNKLLLFLYTR